MKQRKKQMLTVSFPTKNSLSTQYSLPLFIHEQKTSEEKRLYTYT